MSADRRALLAGIALVVAGCGRTTTASKGGHRVVSTTPNTTEALFAIGVGPSVVGRSRYCDYPSLVKDLPQIGGYADPNFEAILALRPTLVTGARGPSGSALATKLSTLGIDTFFPTTDAIVDIEAMIAGLGARLGAAAQAKTTIEAMRAERGRVAEQVAGRAEPRVLLVFGVSPIAVAGQGTFADEMLRLAGGRNALAGSAAAPSSPWPILDLEKVIALDPDVVLDAAIQEHGNERLGPTWSAVRAVREGRVVALNDEAVLRPGPRVGRGIITIARALHPGIAL